MIFASLHLLTSVFPGGGRGQHSRPQLQGCCRGRRRTATGSGERIAGSSGSSFSASDADVAAAVAAAAGLADVGAAW